MQSTSKSSLDKKIEKYINSLQNIIYAAQLNFEVWRAYNDVDTRPKYASTMNNYVMFFRTSIHAHFVALLIALYKLFEKRDDTINFNGLIKLLEKSNKFSKSDVNDLKTSYIEAKRIWEKVSILRNSLFAHQYNSLSNSEVFKRAQITPNELKALIDNSQNIFNKITYKWDGSSNSFLPGAREDTIKLLENLFGFKNKL